MSLHLGLQVKKFLLLLVIASALSSGCTILKDDTQNLVFNPLALLFPEDSIFDSGELLSAEPRHDYSQGRQR
jgi:hypothetical protein